MKYLHNSDYLGTGYGMSGLLIYGAVSWLLLCYSPTLHSQDVQWILSTPTWTTTSASLRRK